MQNIVRRYYWSHTIWGNCPHGRYGRSYVHGELVEWGTKEEILKNPAHPYTKALIRAIPTMDGKLPESVYVEERMPYTEISKTHWAGTRG